MASGSPGGETRGVERPAHPPVFVSGVVHTSLLFEGRDIEAIEHWIGVEKSFRQTQAIDLVHLSKALDGHSE